MNIRQAIQRPVSHTALVAITILGVVRDGAEWPYDVAEASRISGCAGGWWRRAT